STLKRGVEWLIKNQRSGGAWGSHVYDDEGDCPSTAYGLIAMSEVGGNEFSSSINKATDTLVRAQLPSGGWPSTPGIVEEGRKGHVGYTAFALMGLARAPKNARRADAIQNGILYLLRSQNPDGGWGFGPAQLTDPC